MLPLFFIFIRIFQAVFNTLVPGGCFIFNAPNFDTQRAKEYTHQKTQNYPTPDGSEVVVYEFNTLSGRKLYHTQRCTISVVGTDSSVLPRKDTFFDMNTFYMFTRSEFSHALNLAGFDVSWFSNGLVPVAPNDKDMQQNPRSLYAVARKPV